MQTFLGTQDAPALLSRARENAAAGRIDPLADLVDDRAYIFSGTRDTTVTRPVVDAARDFYRAAGLAAQRIKYVNDIAAGHAFVVEEARNACGVTQSPFINDCDYDQAWSSPTWRRRRSVSATAVRIGSTGSRVGLKRATGSRYALSGRAIESDSTIRFRRSMKAPREYSRRRPALREQINTGALLVGIGRRNPV
jgi:hypothetical protein